MEKPTHGLAFVGEAKGLRSFLSVSPQGVHRMGERRAPLVLQRWHAAEGGYSTLAQINTVELCLPVMGLLLGPDLIYKDFPSTLN